MRTIQVGIIGQGRSGYDIHARTIKRLPEQFRIAAVSDRDEAYRKRAENEFGCEAYEDYRDLFARKDIDLIVNASPSHLHVPITLEALEAGFHVLCEKPLARTAEEVDRLIEASEKAGKLLTVFQQSRFLPGFQKMMDILSSGVLGRLIQVNISFNGFARRWDWQTLQENNGGNLLNTGPHPLDQALQLFGDEFMPDIVCCMDRVNTFGDAEDYVKLLMRGPNHPVLDLEISSCDAFPPATYRIQGQYGGLTGTAAELRWKYFDPQQAPKQQLIRTPMKKPDGSPAYPQETLAWTEEAWTLPEEQKNTFEFACNAMYQKLYDSVANGAPLAVTAQQVRRQIAVIEECHRQNPLSRLEPSQ